MADALARGCSLESDVRLSADGVPVLVHDAYRRRLGVPLVIRWTSADRLARVGVVSLAELYRQLGTDYDLSIDLKDPRAEAATRAMAVEAGAIDRLWLVHDDLALLAKIRAADDRVRLVHETRLGDLAARGITPSDHIDTLADQGISAQNTHWADWTPDMVDHAHARGLLAFGSLAHERSQLEDALGRGLDGVYSDHLDMLCAAAREMPG